jgi:hypothetical protein
VVAFRYYSATVIAPRWRPVFSRIDARRKRAEKTSDRGDDLPTTKSKLVRDQQSPAPMKPGLFVCPPARRTLATLTVNGNDGPILIGEGLARRKKRENWYPHLAASMKGCTRLPWPRS